MKITEPIFLPVNGNIVPHAQNPEVIRKAQTGNENAINIIIDENEGLICDIAITEPEKTPVLVDIDDLMQAGKLGFMEAMKEYDSTKGTKLTTYATYWIRSHIQQEIVTARTIRIPIKGVNSTQGKRTRRVHSIHATKSDDSLPKENFLESNEEDVVSTATRNDFQREFHRKINKLVQEQIITEQEKEILFMRFGINRPSGLTSEEISETFNPPIAISEIEKIINEVTEKLKTHLITLEDNSPTINQTEVAQNNIAVTESTSPVLVILTTTKRQTSEKE
ncbi:MAG: sigma-70 family RNA polymerase sigma factor, partial [Candidatus Melainabacteria bacterium]|nr:sigma-70 family RNA polymerase sigma factor [Candidatus Melainabacteria bacterium]